MQSWWIPIDCTDLLGDTIHFDRSMDSIVAKARNHKSFLFNKKIKLDGHECEQCGIRESLSVHHIRPLWSFAVEYLCDGFLIGSRRSVITIQESEYMRWNAMTNLIALCRKCHDGAERDADRAWRKTLVDKYHPHFCVSYADAKKNYAKFWNK